MAQPDKARHSKVIKKYRCFILSPVGHIVLYLVVMPSLMSVLIAGPLSHALWANYTGNEEEI